jgi:prevent-host-death family protein
MREVPTSEFTRNFGQYRKIVQREPIAVMNRGRPTAYLVSADEFEELQRYKKLARQPFATIDLKRDDVEAITTGRMSAEHGHLNSLLDDK